MLFLRKLVCLLLVLAQVVFSTPSFASQGTLQVPTTSGQSGLSVINSVNSALLALATCNSGSSPPTNGPSSVAFAQQCWWDTTTNPWVFKVYDGTSWATVLTLNTSTHVVSISANTINGVAFPSSPSTHQMAIVTSANQVTWKTIVDCPDTGGQHANYAQSTDSWSCGTSTGTPTAGEPWAINGLLPEWYANNIIAIDGGALSSGSNSLTPDKWAYSGVTQLNFTTVGRLGIDSCNAKVNPSYTTTSSNIASLGSAGTGTITVGDTTNFPTAAFSMLVGSERMTATTATATTFTISARAQYGSTGATHSNGSTISFDDFPPAGCTNPTGPPTYDSAWYPWALWCDAKTATTFVLSQSEVFGEVTLPSGCTTAYMRLLPISFVYRASCSVNSTGTGTPQFQVLGWPGGPQIQYYGINTGGCWDIGTTVAGAGVSSWTDIDMSNFCGNQQMRFGWVQFQITRNGGDGTALVRGKGDNTNTGLPLARVTGSGDVRYASAWINLGAGDHWRAGRLQVASTSGVDVLARALGCGSSTQ